MWQSNISIDHRYDLGDIIGGYLKNIDINNAYALIGSRDVFSIAGDKSKKADVENMISKILLQHLKYQYFARNGVCVTNSDSTNLLIAEMLFFDNAYEKDVLSNILPHQYDYSIDGIYHFLMGEMRSNWDYLIELYSCVDDGDDKILLAKYMHESAVKYDKKLYMTRKKGNSYLFDIASGDIIDNIRLTDREEVNDMFKVISQHSNYLYVEKEYRFTIPIDVIKMVQRVEFV